MFGGRGNDEPEVELLGDDAIVGTGAVAAERSRSWWPVWVGAGVLALVGLVGLMGTGDDGGSEPADAAPISVDDDSADAGPTSTTEAEGSPERTDANSSRETWPSTDATSSGDGSENSGDSDAASVNTDEVAAALNGLGLTGHIFAWSGERIDRLDLATGEWVRLEVEVDLPSDPWSSQMAATPVGFVTAVGGSAMSLDIDGRLLDRHRADGVSEASLVTMGGQVWFLASDLQAGPTPEMDLVATNAIGEFETVRTIDQFDIGFGPNNIVASRGRVLVSHIAGGVFDLVDPATPRVAGGLLIQGNDDELLSYQCAETLESCGVYRLDPASWERLERVDTTNSPAMFFGGQRGWSPDLRYWVPPWGGELLDTSTGTTRPYRPTNPSEITTWTADSRYLLTGDPRRVRVQDAATGDVVEIPGPQLDSRTRWNPTLLHRP